MRMVSNQLFLENICMREDANQSEEEILEVLEVLDLRAVIFLQVPFFLTDLQLVFPQQSHTSALVPKTQKTQSLLL